jgi:vanillate O-demethylase ferredoxin subunit
MAARYADLDVRSIVWSFVQSLTQVWSRRQYGDRRSAMTMATSPARVVDKTRLSSEVCGLTLECETGRFTGLEPGSHIDVHLAGDVVRQYSLTGWDDTCARLSLAVKHETDGRGGSAAMHALQIGDTVQLAGPRNHFRMVEDDRPRVLVAGGIGITPLLAMAKDMAGTLAFDLHYFVRNRSLAIFDRELRDLGLGERYALHCDDEEGIPDFMHLVGAHPADARFYVCGPEIMLTSLQKACEELGRGSVHFERFAAVPHEAEAAQQFEVVLSSTGQSFTVGAEQSILGVLRDAGQDVDWGCTEGVCGTCITDVLEGEIEHLDSVLSDEEHAAQDCMCLCVSRARGARLVLDL